MDPILVTGGTGRLGRHVVRRLKDAGCDVRVLTRRASQQETGVRFLNGDLLSGSGVNTAVDDVGTIVHCAGSGKGDDVATRNLVDAARRAGRAHVIYISVVGAERVPVTGAIDRMMFSYFDTKRKAEQVVEGSGLPWTTIRASQFHELLLMMAEALAKLPVIPFASGVAFQPIAAGEVADRLVELAFGPPSQLVPDIAGPQVEPMRDLIAAYLRAAGRRRMLLPVWLPGAAARAVRAGANLAPDRAVGTKTWEGFLAERLPVAAQVH